MEENEQDMLAMMERFRRLQKIMQPPQNTVALPQKEEPKQPWEEKSENMLLAAIPFLDLEYQQGIYVMVRLMELRRVLDGGLLVTRSKEELPPMVRRRRMLAAVRQYLSPTEQSQLDNMLKMMDMKQIMEQKEVFDGKYMDKTRNTGIGGKKNCHSQRGTTKM